MRESSYDRYKSRHRKDRGEYEKLEEKRKKKHKHERTREESIFAIEPSHQGTSEVIEIHGSSSEEGDSPESHVNKNKHKRSHSHRHRKHRKHEVVDMKPPEKKSDPTENYRSNKRPDERREDNRDDSKRRHRKHPRDEEPDDRREKDRKPNVLLENVRVKEEKIDGDNGRERTRHKRMSDERESREEKRVKEEAREHSRSPVNDTTNRQNKTSSSRSRETRRPEREDNERKEVKKESRNGPIGRNQRRRDDGDDNYEWGQSGSGDAAAPAAADANVKTEPGDKEGPDFKLSGKLTEDRNTYNGVVIKYSEPPEARMPKKRWRLYQFKGEEALPTLYIHRQSAYLIGRDRKVADLPVDHPSCSKQHAALQYRLVTYERPDGRMGKQIRLYVIDLESANGTFINGTKIECKKYVELLEKDVIKFGFSSREYVLLHEQSKDDELSGDDE